MSNIEKAFKGKKIFIPFLTAGDPDIGTTKECIYKMEEAGAGLIEIGIPFSDPIAEGTVIQAANIRALTGGINLDKIFELVFDVRKKVKIPIVFLTYVNPVFNYGYDAFFDKCKEVGINGIIIPDLPYEEKDEVSTVAEKYDIDIISLIAPTSKDRIKKIARNAKGYIYAVSSMGVTGVRSEITTDMKSIVKIIKEATETPVAIGFGINTKEQAEYFSSVSDGVITGSAIVKIIEKYGKNSPKYVYNYVKEMVEAVNKNNL